MSNGEAQNIQQQIDTQVYPQLKDDFNSIKLRLDPTPTLELIRHSLLREHWQASSETWVNPRNLRPMLTAEGVEDLMIDLCARMSVDKVLGNIKDKEFNWVLREIGEALLGFIVYNSEQYKISEADIDRIFHIIMHNIRIFLSRARGGLENIHLAKQMQYRETRSARAMDGQPLQTGGGAFNFFGGGKR